MKWVNSIVIATVMGGSFLFAQALRDKVIVDLPYRVTLDDKTTLEPGEYSINQITDSGGGRYVLQIRKGDIEHEALVQSIPATDNNTKEDTKVLLHKLSDGSYRFDKIWVQGKDYGYEFPLPEAIRDRERERMTSSAITARHDAGDATQEGQPAPSTADEKRTSAAITDQSGTSASTPNQPGSTNTTTADSETQSASSTGAPANQPGSDQVTTQVQTQDTDASNDQSVNADQTADQSAFRSASDISGDELPQTASQWFTMLTAGLGLMGGGLAIRRRK